ncbi:MAG: hypothetical protein M3T55_10035 [Pseudomonadota bacterium]|nr:hypothetical protein [Pseudomonadota bacterium]
MFAWTESRSLAEGGVHERIETLSIRVPQSIAAALTLVIHIVVAVGLFAVITAAAVALNLVTKMCERGDLAPTWAIQGMRGLEILLWAGDVLCFVLLVLVEIRKFCITVWNGRGA